MKKQKLNDVLSNNTYPGRGICLGVDESGEYAVIVYFIMGRSVNSRNRIFEETDDGIITKAHDESLMTDPHLIIYAPVRAQRASPVQCRCVFLYRYDCRAQRSVQVLRFFAWNKNGQQ